MAKLLTGKDKRKQPTVAQVANIAELARQYVQTWAREEAQKIVKDELVIIPTKNGMQVGKYAVKHTNKLWEVYNSFSVLVDAFSCKQSAVVYSILDQRNKLNTARELLRQDGRVLKLEQDYTYFTHRRSKAIKSKDEFTAGMLDARIEEVDSKLNLARQDLEETLKRAKYLKGIWE